jgi:hypothetical protein
MKLLMIASELEPQYFSKTNEHQLLTATFSMTDAIFIFPPLFLFLFIIYLSIPHLILHFYRLNLV